MQNRRDRIIYRCRRDAIEFDNSTAAKFQKSCNTLRTRDHHTVVFRREPKLVVCDERCGEATPFCLGHEAESKFALAASGRTDEKQPGSIDRDGWCMVIDAVSVHLCVLRAAIA